MSVALSILLQENRPPWVFARAINTHLAHCPTPEFILTELLDRRYTQRAASLRLA